MPTLLPQIDLVGLHERALPDRVARGHGALSGAALQGARAIAFGVGADCA